MGQIGAEGSSIEEVHSLKIAEYHPSHPTYKGTSIYYDFYERQELPFKRDPNEKIPVWNIMKKFVGKDLTRVSMPCILNEPLGQL